MMIVMECEKGHIIQSRLNAMEGILKWIRRYN